MIEKISDRSNQDMQVFERYTNTLYKQLEGNRQKQIELCHVGKFLMLLGGEVSIVEATEQPDFILKSQNSEIGLEHQIIVDNKEKRQEGQFETIISAIEKELQNEPDLPNFLANIHIVPNVTYKLHEKKNIVLLLKNIVIEYLKTGKLKENDYIEHISIQQPHSFKTLSIVSAWWQNYITQDILQQAIEKKEAKLDCYQKSHPIPMWLLLVIGGIGGSSYVIENHNTIEKIPNSKFSRIYLLEDIYSNLYQLK